MIVRQYAPCNLGRNTICLGKQGEINALRVEFDVSAWMAMYPEAAVKLMHFAPDRPQDNPVIPTLGVEGTTRVWIVGEDDTASAGNGVIELLLLDERTGSTIKSATGYTTVLHSPSAGIESQEAEAGYVRYDIDQSALLTDEQKAVARKNIGAGTGDGTGGGTGGITVEKDPTVPAWAKQPRKPTYEASEVGADAAGTASGAVAAHNTSGAAHADLRALIEVLTSRLNALADSDDTTLDQLSEIVAYIKSNRSLLDAVTTGKVSTSDIVDNLTTNASGKVLSAAQGVVLKAMIDGIVIPTALPNPQPITINGQLYDGSEAVTVTVSSEGVGTPVEIDDTLTQSGKAADAKVVGDQLSALNSANAAQNTEIAKKANDADLAKVAKSGSYDDLTGKPTIPTVPSSLPNPNALTFTGAVNETYDGSAAKSVSIPTIPESLKNPNKLILSGAVTAEYDGSTQVSVEIPAGGGGDGGGLANAFTYSIIASGTVAKDTAKGYVDTGVTYGDLREYDIVAFQVRAAGNSKAASSTGIGYNNQSWNNWFYSKSGEAFFVVIKWVDKEKTISQTIGTSASAYHGNINYINDIRPVGTTWQKDYGSFNPCFAKCPYADSTPINVTFGDTLLDNLNWAIGGVKF